MAIPEKLRIRINLVAFLFISFGLIYAMATQVLTVLEGRYSVNAIFTDAGGVFTDQEVTYRGITVGQVGEMEVVEEGVKIELIIEDEYQIPAEDVQARVMFKSAVGEQFVDILPNSKSEPYLEDGDTIPVANTSIPVSTQALLTTTQSVLEGVPPEALSGAINSLAEGLAGNGQDIALLLESLADLSDLFAERAPETIGILRNGTQVGDAFLRSKEDFTNAIRDLIDVADLLADNRPTIERLLENSNLLSDELVTLIRENRGVLNQVIQEFADINEFQAEAGLEIRELLAQLPRSLQTVVKTFESKTGLVRFGFIGDPSQTGPPACTYGGINKKPPQDRDPKLPPKAARCDKSIKGPDGSSSSTERLGGDPSGDTEETSPPGAAGEVEDLLLPDLSDTSQRLPERMEHMGWMFFYLNGLR
ncbi:MAG: MCE family protein [Actinomycetota bacterium]|nr:MCE family protein [Actinomycetota bacterium]